MHQRHHQQNRYQGTDVAVMTPWDPSEAPGGPAAAFAATYRREFGFTLARPVAVDDARVRATGRAAALPEPQVCDAAGGRLRQGAC